MWPFSSGPTVVHVHLGADELAVLSALAHLDDHTSDVDTQDRYAAEHPEEGAEMPETDEDTVQVPIRELTERQLLRLMVAQQRTIIENQRRMEERMSDLTAAVDDLKGAVDGVAQRLLPKLRDLEAALADAQSRLSDALADDAEAAQVFADAQAAAQEIRTEVGRLNALGADPSTPVDTDTDPVEPPPVEVDPDDQPHPDNTLPGDLR